MTSRFETEIIRRLKAKDNITYEHSNRVAYLAALIGIEMKLPSTEVLELKRAGLFHDVGKTNISSKILTKEGSLTDLEYKKMKNHTVLGYCIIPNDEEDKRIKEVALLHHERIDGSGYPFGLTNIPLFARIIAVADTFDAMTNKRPYNDPQDDIIALMELRKQSQIQIDENGKKHQEFDPEIVEAFIKAYVKEFMKQETNNVPKRYNTLKKVSNQ